MTRVDWKMSQEHRIYKENHKVICTLLYLKILTKLKIAINKQDRSTFSRMIFK
jgi:hypothetical protein